MAKEHWQLSVLTWLVLINLSQRINLLIQVRVHNLVTVVVMWLTCMPDVLLSVRRVEILKHFCFILIIIIFYLIFRILSFQHFFIE